MKLKEILDNLIESREGDRVFDKTDTDFPLYNRMLDDKEYFQRSKGVTWDIEYMTPREYMVRSAEIHGKSVESEYDFVSDERVKKYAELMRRGEVFPMPYIDYVDRYQEGRHRVLAFGKAFDKFDVIPVMVIREYEGEIEYPEDDIRSKYIDWGD